MAAAPPLSPLPASAVPEALIGGDKRERDEADKVARIKAGERTIEIFGFAEG